VNPAQVTIALELGSQTQILSALLAAARTELLEVGVSDAYEQELTLEHFPVTGSKRVLARRTGYGTDGMALPTTGALVLQANEARIGCRITNSGSNPVILYLSDAKRAGFPALYLGVATPGNEVLGASWDGKLGNAVWCGNVWAVPQGGASTLVVAEL
jgi:hypothetical protein